MNWLDKHQMKIFYVMLGFLLVFTVFIGFSVRGKCATQANGSLPYNVPQYRDANNTISDEVLELMYTRLIGVVRDDLHYSGDVSFLVFTIDGTSTAGWSDVYFIPNPTIDTVSPNYNFLDGYIRVWSNDLQIFRCMVRNTNLTLNGVSVFTNQGRYADLLGDSSTSNQNGFNFTPRYPFKMIGIEEIVSSNDVVVFTNTVAPVEVNGHATPPDLTQDNIGNDKPDIDDYLPNLPSQPSFDDSSLESMVESIYNWLKWEYNALKGTLQGLFSYLADTITYSFQKVIDNIKNLIKNFYDNMVSLFEPLLNAFSVYLNSISQKVDYITEPIDSEEIQDSIEGTNFYGIYSDYKSFFYTFDSVITGTSEPNSLIIPIHLENISTLAQFGVTCQYLDLTQFAEIRSPLRAFCWVFCSFGAIMLVAHSLPDWLKGSSGGGSSSVSGKEG